MRRILNTPAGPQPTTVALESLPEDMNIGCLDHLVAAIEAECLRVEEAVDVADTLTELVNAASTAPLNAQSGAIMQVATESLLARVGVALEDGEMVVYDPHAGLKPIKPADKPAEEPAKSGLAKVGEKIKEIWEAIVKAIKRAFDWVKNLFRRFFDMAGKLKKFAEQTLKQLQEIEKESPHPKNPDVRQMDHAGNWRVASHLRIQFDKYPEQMVEAAQEAHKIIAAQFERFSSSKASELYDGKFFQMISEGKIEEIPYEPASEKLKSHLTVPLEHSAGDAALWGSVRIIGEERVVQLIHAKSCKGAEALRWLQHTPALKADAGKVTGHVDPYHNERYSYGLSRSLPAVSLKEAQELCKVAIEFCDHVLKFRDVETKLQRLGDDMVKFAQKKISTTEKDALDADPKKEVVQRDYLLAGPRIFASEPMKLINYSLNTAQALVGYAKKMGDVHTGKGFEFSERGKRYF